MKKYVISTEVYKDRLDKFLLANSHLEDLHVKMGINSFELGDTPLRDPRISPYLREPCSWKLGAICCAIAHLDIIKEVATFRYPVTVFEDDAILPKNFERASSELIAQLAPDWDIIQWGFNWDAFMWMRLQSRNGPILKIDLCKKESYLDLEDFKNGTTNSYLFPLELSFGMHAYSLNPSGARKILKNFTGIKDQLIVSSSLNIAFQSISLDCDLNSFYPKFNSFVAFPPISFVENNKLNSAIWNPTAFSSGEPN